MVEPTHQSRCTGDGFKPPKGALVKSQGIERLGESDPRGQQVSIKEMNASKPLKRCREVANLQSKATKYDTELKVVFSNTKYGGNLFTFRMAGAIQMA